ncbi:putative receptor-like protein kinase At4g00960 isoform X2 [Phoenix dactylifera]|uniref:Receptor-like protein kinase At4g00960 isoform X2 n=1 Tax=Phoenix dactylifera TaxID=42345 RepID=A0A8B8J219_PHODC|nr:putative receptor-like protein kinase At4g00960 isoform X2 [Phoenix dactylifera]
MFLSLPSSSSSLFRLCLLLFLLHSPPVAAGDPIFSFCGSGNYSANSNYEVNLDILLPTLANDASLSSTGFSNLSISQKPNPAYGLALCRGDINTSLCLSCLNTSNHAIVRLCPYKVEAVVWYDLCLLRHSSQDSLATTEESEEKLTWNGNDITTDVVPLFKNQLNELLSTITHWAAYNTTRKFATGEVNFTTDIRTIYGLVQCTPDLGAGPCQQCLREIIQLLLTGVGLKQGGRVLRVQCNFRYELYKFYDGASTLRLGSPTPGNPAREKGNKKNATDIVLKIAIPLVSSSLLISITCICFWTRWKSAKNLPYEEDNLEEITHSESLLLDLSVLRAATANFAEENKLGVGGFGAVYKGILPNRQECAVKRLSTTSRQGLAELKNELVLVAHLRHKNLVRLLGVCLEEQEKLLAYEYVPNRSLDTILFDPVKREQLNWERRHKIIRGIARGLLYLHEDSQLRIIHRDLKAGNILLDADMNPKISDFGLARLFGGDQSQSFTTRVVGTFGYMPPEYVMHGQFSIKSDVYSYGVLVLEILTGRKNSGSSNSESGRYLLADIWEQWNKGTVLEILDSCLGSHCPTTEVLRCIQIGLLCVQEDPSDRPNMSTVVMLLYSDSASIQAPSRPAFCTRQSVMDSYAHANEFNLRGGIHNQYLDRLITVSLNEMSVTEFEPR